MYMVDWTTGPFQTDDNYLASQWLMHETCISNRIIAATAYSGYVCKYIQNSGLAVEEHYCRLLLA